jgi:hypothetical protein
MSKSGQDQADIANKSRIYSEILRSMGPEDTEAAKSCGNKIEIPIQLGFLMLSS